MEITGVADTTHNTGNTEITGVEDNVVNKNVYDMGMDDMGDVNENANDVDDDVNVNNDANEGINDNISNYNNPDTENNDTIDTADDDISIEGELPNDTYVTIDNINIVREMNNAQLNNSPETEEEGDAEAINNNLHSHRYNLRPRPTTRNQKYTLTQLNNQLNMPKTHAHIMMSPKR